MPRYVQAGYRVRMETSACYKFLVDIEIVSFLVKLLMRHIRE